MTDPHPLLRILAARASAMPLTAKAENRYRSMGAVRLNETIRAESQPRRKRAALLVKAIAAAEGGGVTALEDSVDAYLAHLEHSALDPDQPPGRRAALARSHEVLRDAARSERPSLDLKGLPDPSSTDWADAVGMPEGEYVSEVYATLGSRLSDREGVEFPIWLDLSLARRPDFYECSSAPWQSVETDDTADDLQASVNDGWVAFSQGYVTLAHDLLKPLRERCGLDWGPGSTIESRHLWNWLRFLYYRTHPHELGSERRRQSLGRRELFNRLPMDARSLIEHLSEDEYASSVLEGLEPGDIRVESEWGRVAAHVGFLLRDHEPAVRDLSGERRARLRDAWSRRFGDWIDADADTTRAISHELRSARSDLEAAVRAAPRKAAEGDLDVSPDLNRLYMAFLDEEEQALFKAIQDQLKSAKNLVGLPLDEVSIDDVERIRLDLDRLGDDARQMFSLTIQEGMLPLVARAQRLVDDVARAIETSAPPELSFDLPVRRVPLLSIGASTVLRISVNNMGTVAARNVNVSAACNSLDFEVSSVELPSVEPGASLYIRLSGSTSREAKSATLTIDATWSDDFDRVFKSQDTFAIESQRPSNWRPDDSNPYSLNAIDEPDRLVGREADLQALRDIVLAGESTYITGHKRVGKSSLARVLLRTLPEGSCAGGRVALGRVLGDTPRAADLVFGLLQTIGKAIQKSWPVKSVDLPERHAFEENFALAANEWLETASASLSPGERVIAVIDDFDELPERLASGDEGDALFRFLRSLIEESWLSLVFVGSEVLRSIISERQGVKLNTVSETSLQGFASPVDTYRLLREPASNRLDWDDGALRSVHVLSAGNPYYATLLGQTIWRMLRDSDRAYVVEDDVSAAAAEISRMRTDRHFSHFWADGPAGVDVSGQRSVICAGVLRAIALSAPRSRGSWASENQALDTACDLMPSIARPDLARYIRMLVSRRILESEPTGSSLRIGVPLCSEWLAGAGGASQIGRLLEDSGLSSRPDPVLAPGAILDVSEKLIFQGSPVSDIRIRAWLEQFGGSWNQHLAFRLLQRLSDEGFFSDDLMSTRVYPALAKAILRTEAGRYQRLTDAKGRRKYRENFYLLDRRRGGSSADVTNRALLASLGIRKQTNLITEDRLAHIFETTGHTGRSVLLVVDDFLGSGTQMAKTTSELVGSLEQIDSGWPEKLLVVMGAGLVDRVDALDSLEREGVVSAFGKTIGPRLRAFDPDSQLFEDDERGKAEELCRTIGRSINPDHPLGFGGHALLVSFAANCPNNTLPIFWATGEYLRTEWRPLLPRL